MCRCAGRMMLLLIAGLGPGACTSVQEPAGAEQRLAFTSANNLVLVPGSVNGSPSWFVLDTGAAQTVLSARLAQAAGARQGASTWQYGYGAAIVPSRVLSDVTVQLGELRLPISGARAAPPQMFESLGRAVNHRIDGILGQELFRRYVVQIDYRNRIISLYEPTEFKQSGGQIIPLTIEHGYAIADALARPTSASEPVPCRLIVDTGSNDQVVLREQFVAAHHAAFAGWTTTRLGTMHGVGGASETRGGVLTDLRLGDAKSPAFPYVDVTINAGNSPFPADGAVGSGLFQQSTVIFDYSRRRMIVIRH